MRSMRRQYASSCTRVSLWRGLCGLGVLGLLSGLSAMPALPSALHSAHVVEPPGCEETWHPHQGRIVDRQGRLLALDLMGYALWLQPAALTQRDAVARHLAAVLAQPVATMQRQLARLAQEDWLAWFGVPSEVAAQVQQRALPGLTVACTTHRFYLHRHLARPVLRGIEQVYQEPLTNGADLVLTLDIRLQHVAEQALATQVEATQARRGAVLVMQPQTGDLLAMALYPFVNPNDPSHLGLSSEPSPWPVTALVEPGVLITPLVVAAALAEHVVHPDEWRGDAHGLWGWAGPRRQDAGPSSGRHGAEGLEQASTSSLAQLRERLRAFQWYRALRRFGFGTPTRVDLPDETAGRLQLPDPGLHGAQAAQALGQGLTVTPIQVVTAYAAVANGGRVMRPRLVGHIVEGDTMHDLPSIRHRQVLAPQTAATLRGMVAEGVGDGTAPSVVIAGATVGEPASGTWPAGQRGDSGPPSVMALVGFVPVEEPQAVILVMLEEPQGTPEGTQAVAAVWQRMAHEVLRAGPGH